VAAEAGIPEARQIDDSQVRQFAPDVVLLVGDWSPTNTQYLTSNPVYHGIAAFDRSRVYPIASPGKDPAHLVADVQTLVNLLHPALF
jgi:ABC-type Fe3+-hydroxamate transport system substrate-binding protein